jgi:hypothetical protein
MNFTGTPLYAMILFWSVGIFYTIMDLTGHPKALRKYKIQPGVNDPLEPRKLVKVSVFVDFYIMAVYEND